MKRCITLHLVTLTLVATNSAWAEVTLDGSLGRAGALPGPNYQIGANLGQQQGGNLFHSFRDFNLQSHESATFSGPTNVQNVISRVTGGNPSSIDGTLRSTIPNANLYFLNPFGIMFGPNAKLDVQGSFHASTADYLRLQDGGQFNARVPSNSLLTVAPPEAFGFLTNTPAAISIQDSHLSVPEGKTLSLIGGDLRLTGSKPYTIDKTTGELKFNAELLAPGGRINLASVASQGEVISSDTELSLSQVARPGAILAQNASIDTSGRHGGSVFIRGGQFELTGSGVFSQTNGDQNGSPIDVQVDNLKILQGSRISSTTNGTGNAGSVAIKADTMEISGKPESGNRNMIISASTTENSGNAGQIEITTRQLTLADSARIYSVTAGQGQGGAITLKVADNLTLTGSDIVANSYGTMPQAGNAGNLTIQARQVTLADGAQLNSLTNGTGQGGTTHLQVSDTLTVTGQDAEGNASAISAGSYNEEVEKAGNAGRIEIEARQIVLSNGGRLRNNTFGTGQGGSIILKVADNLTLTGFDKEGNSGGISAGSAGTMPQAGNAGRIEIEARQIELTNGGRLASTTLGTGQGGSILLKGIDTLTVSGNTANGVSSVIEANSDSDNNADNAGNAGNAGNIDIEARQITLTENGQIYSFTVGAGKGGKVVLHGVDTLRVNEQSEITASSNGKENSGDAGSIEIEARQVMLTNGGQLRSDTIGTGQGGSILLKVADNLTLTGLDKKGNSSSIGASSYGTMPQAGNAGRIEIEARQIVLTDGGGLRSFTYGTGQGGSILLKGIDTLNITNGTINASSGNPELVNAGDAGNIDIQARQINLTADGFIASATLGVGKGGKVVLRGVDTLVVNESSIGSVSGSSKENSGDAGEVRIEVRQVTLTNGGQINTATHNAGGGNITISTSNLLYLQQGQVITSVTGGTGNGGNITINKPVFVVLNQGQIKAQADQGRGGNIDITSRQYLKTPLSTVSASSRLGINGTVTIRAPNETVSNSLNLPPDLLDVTNQLPKLCHELSEEEYDNLSHFFVHPRAVTGESPDDLQGSSVWFLLPYFRTTPPPPGKVPPPARQGQVQAEAKPWLVMMECQKLKKTAEKKSAGKAKQQVQ